MAIHKNTHEVRAIKIVLKDRFNEEYQHKIKKEIDIMKTLDHPNIVKIFEHFKNKNFIFIVMEHLEGGELFEMILK